MVFSRKGWGGLGGGITVPDSVYLIGACPHTWLFGMYYGLFVNRISNNYLEKCFAVCHHGGAGTTATGTFHSHQQCVYCVGN